MSLRRVFSALVLAGPVLLGGCATYDLSSPPPAQTAPVAIVYSSDGASGWNDVPMGTYSVPDSDVVISGHQGGGNIGMLFGLVGVLAQSAVNSSRGASAVNPVQDALHIHLTPQAVELTQKILASGKYGQSFTMTPSADGPTVTVTSYTVVTFVTDNETRPYVVLKAKLTPGKAGGKAWTARYIASSGAPAALAGPGSLTDNGGALLKADLARDLDWAVNAMLSDMANPQARAGGAPVNVETAVPFIRQRWSLPGVTIAQDDSKLVFVPHVADAVVFAGVHIVDKSAVTIHPGAGDDKIRLLDEAP
ncbi:MAG TPA: hypothetical protein VHZ78_12985 [Rhizomicrobium sp.]|jgi:hypothetical protein|nr:hypothetical protein [Rhizomicrobium sp.]